MTTATFRARCAWFSLSREYPSDILSGLGELVPEFSGGSRHRHFPIFHLLSSTAVLYFLGPHVALWRKPSSCEYPPSQTGCLSFCSFQTLFSHLLILHLLHLPKFLSENTDISWFLNVEFDSFSPLFRVIFERKMEQKHFYSTILKWEPMHGLNCGLPAPTPEFIC